MGDPQEPFFSTLLDGRLEARLRVGGRHAETIRRLKKLEHIYWGGEGDPLVKIAGALYHQRDPNTGSYAVVPHLVRIAQSRPPSERFLLVTLCVWIEQDRTRQTALDTTRPRSGYLRALGRAKEMAVEMLTMRGYSWGSHGWPYDLRYVLKAIAIFRASGASPASSITLMNSNTAIEKFMGRRLAAMGPVAPGLLGRGRMAERRASARTLGLRYSQMSISCNSLISKGAMRNEGHRRAWQIEPT